MTGSGDARTQVMRQVLRAVRPTRFMSIWARYAIATLIVAGLYALRAALGDEIGPSPYMLFFPGIIVVSFAFDRGSGLYTTALAVVCVSRLREPGQSLAIPNVGAGIGLVLFCVIGMFCAAVIGALRLSVEELGEKEAALEQLVEERTAALMRAAEDRRRAEEALRHGEKLQAVGQLTGEIAHDFNNFLQVITGGVHLLRRETLTERRRLAVLDGMGKAAKNAAELTRRLLSFGRRQALRPETIDLNARLADMAGMLRQTLASRATLQTHFGAGLWPVRVDPDQLEVAILNLAVNARDAMPRGGMVTIATRNMVQATSEQQGDFVELAVGDDGEGIPEAVLARVFEPFFTTKGPEKGTGLGLAQVQAFVQQSGGNALIESVPGQGTTVRLRLPRCVDATPKRADGGAEIAQMMMRAAGRRVLVVDDNADVASFAEAILAELGYRTLRAADATEALALVEGGAAIDAVFTDVVMPGPMNGLDLAQRLRDTRPELGVVLASGYSEALANCNGPRHWQVLSKPYRQDELGAALERALAAAEGAGEAIGRNAAD